MRKAGRIKIIKMRGLKEGFIEQKELGNPGHDLEAADERSTKMTQDNKVAARGRKALSIAEVFYCSISHGQAPTSRKNDRYWATSRERMRNGQGTRHSKSP